MDKKSYYAVIPAEVRYDKELTPNAKLLYGEISALCNEKGFCWASNNYFAELYGVTPQAISKWVGVLAQKNYISLEYENNGKEIKSRKVYLRVSTNIDRVSTNIDRVSTNDEKGINKRLKGYQQMIKENITINIKENTKRNGINSERVSNGGIVKSLTDNFSLEDMTKYGEEKLLPLKVIKDYKEAYTLWIQEKPTDKNRQGRDLKATVKNWLLRDLKCGKIKPELTPMQEMEEEIKRLGGTLL